MFVCSQERYPEGHPKGGQFKPKDGGDDGQTTDKSQSKKPKGEPDYDVPPHMTSDEYYGTGEHANKPGGRKPGQVAPEMNEEEYADFKQNKNVSQMPQFRAEETAKAMSGYNLQAAGWAVQQLYGAKTPNDFQRGQEQLIQAIQGHISQVEAGQADPYAGLGAAAPARVQGMDPAGRREAARDVHRGYLQKARMRENTVRNTIAEAAYGFIDVSSVGIPSEESSAAVARVEAYEASLPKDLREAYREQEITGDRG